jgi:hypothetical protein
VPGPGGGRLTPVAPGATPADRSGGMSRFFATAVATTLALPLLVLAVWIGPRSSRSF